MTLEELFAADDDSDVPPDFPRMVITVTTEELRASGLPLLESIWLPSHIKGIWVRIDSAKPQMNQLRHVHVSRKKHLKSPNMQASWNDDGTRHDRHNFNDKFGAQADAKDAARIALGLPAMPLLEHLQKPEPSWAAILLESAGVYEGVTSIYFATEKAQGILRDLA